MRARADDAMQARAGGDRDVVRGLGGHRGLAVAGDVLVQRPAAGHVERLGAAADGEDRQAALERQLDQFQLEGVEARLRRAELDVAIRRAVGDRVEIRAAAEADAVEALDQRSEVIGADRREHDGDRPGGVQRPQIRHPQRHFGVRGLAVTASRRHRAGAHLRSGDADEGAHAQMIGRFASIRTHRRSKYRAPGFATRSGFYAPSRDVEPIHLHDVQTEPDPSAGQDSPEGCLAQLLPRRQDRRARTQWVWQVHAAAHHGRGGSRLSRRSPARARRHRRAALPRAPTRREQGRARQRRGRRAPPARPPRSLQRAVDELLRRDRGRVRAPAGPDRRRRRLGARPDARPGDGRAALPAVATPPWRR